MDQKKESDTDSGNCDDICSVHNSTPVIADLKHNVSKSSANAQQSFQSKFLSTTGLLEGADNKVPSSISSGNNSITTNSSHQESPAISQVRLHICYDFLFEQKLINKTNNV